MTDSDSSLMEIQQLDSYGFRYLDDRIRLKLWSDEDGNPITFDVSPDQITMMRIELERAERLKND